MRFDVLRRELNWTVGDVRRPIDLCDAYDRESIAFGVLRARSQLIGAARLILPVGDDLPSLRLLRSLGRHRRFALPTAEISRVMVRRDFRKLGVFRILLLSSLLVAHDAKVHTLIISERDEARFARMMSNYGFIRFADGFSFMDEMITPNEPAATYVLDVHRNLDADSRQAIAALREVLLRAAEALLTAGEADRSSDFG